MKTLKWRQVHAWRVSQHALSPRLKRRDFVKAATRTGGIQAQVMSAAELALWARADGLTPEAVQSALWQKRTLVKTWAMRGTLHLIAASDLPLVAAARSVYDNRNWLGYFAYYGISPAQYEAFIAAVPQMLGSEPMTREQLAAAVAKHLGLPGLGELVAAKGWGSPLKPSAFRGDLCFGPSQGQNITFVRPSQWLGEWQPVEPKTALLEIARRYLRAYGPATVKDFAMWWWGGAGLTAAKRLFKSLAADLEAVSVEGWPAFALRSTLEQMQAMEARNKVNLLPLFDAYVVGLGRDIEPLLPKAYKSQVFRPQGWIAAVVLVDGRMASVWEHKAARRHNLVTVRMFSPATAAIKKGIEAEVERLGIFLNTKVGLEYAAQEPGQH